MKIESKYELKEIDIKNRTCYYIDDTMRVGNIFFNDILLEEKSPESIFIYEISYKNFMVESACVFGSIKWMDWVKFLIELDI